MLYKILFLYVTLMYLKYILNSLNLKMTPLEVLPIGLLIGSFSIFLVHLLSPHTYITYTLDHLVIFDVVNDKAIIQHGWLISKLNFDILRNYVFTGFTEELCKLSAGFLMFMLYKKISLKKLFFYIVLSASFFAFIENIHYLDNYGPRIIIPRIIFSTTIHISLGLILGFFLIKALKQIKFIKMFGYMVLGLFISTFLHGSFNFTITLEEHILHTITWITTIGLGLFLLKIIKKDLE